MAQGYIIIMYICSCVKRGDEIFNLKLYKKNITLCNRADTPITCNYKNNTTPYIHETCYYVSITWDKLSIAYVYVFIYIYIYIYIWKFDSIFSIQCNWKIYKEKYCFIAFFSG